MFDTTDATARRGRRRKTQPSVRSLDPIMDFEQFELPQGDDPYADVGDRGARPDYDSSMSSSMRSGRVRKLIKYKIGLRYFSTEL